VLPGVVAPLDGVAVGEVAPLAEPPPDELPHAATSTAEHATVAAAISIRAGFVGDVMCMSSLFGPPMHNS
jgi:hypothetical protein